MKKTAIKIGILVLIALCAAPSVSASPYITTSCTDPSCYGTAVFSYVNGNIQVNIGPDQITNTSNGPNDKLVKVGAYLTIYNPEHPNYDFTMTKTSTGTYSISNDPLTFQIQTYATGGAQYLRGNMTQMSLDMNTGSIVWGTITDLQISNTIGSKTLTEFIQGDYNAMNVTQFTLSSMDALQQWVSNPSGSFSSKYCITVTGSQGPTAAPEPSQWILLITGLIVMGSLASRRSPFTART